MILSGNSKYKVSVILTTYNRETYILRAIRSLLKQSFKNFEVIIVDDGSTDKTFTKVSPILKKNNNFSYVYHSNKGFPFSYNTGIKLSAGEFITSLDSDDEYSKHHLKKRVEFFRKNKKTDLIHSPAIIIGSEESKFVPDARNKNKLIHLNDCIIGATLFGKRKVFEDLNGFKNIYGQDFEFVNRASKIFKVQKLEETTYIYHRETPKSILSNLKKEKKLH